MSTKDKRPRSTLLLTITSCVASIIVYKVLNFCTARKRLIEMADQLPGPPLKGSHSWLSHLSILLKTIGKIPGYPDLPLAVPWMLEQGKEDNRHGLFRIWIFNPFRFPFARCLVYIYNPELCRQLLVDKSVYTKLVKDKYVYDVAKPLVGDSFLSMEDGPEWKYHRKLAAMAFHQEFLEFANQTAVRLLNEKVFPIWENNNSNQLEDNNHLQFSLEVVNWANRMILEVLGEVGLSWSFGGLEEDSTEESLFDTYRFMLNYITKKAYSPPGATWFWFRENRHFTKCQKRLDSTIEKIIRERLRQTDSNVVNNISSSTKMNGSSSKKSNRKFHDLLSCMMVETDDGLRLQYKYLFGNTRMFLFAGHDTTAATLANALWELAIHPTKQRKLQEEIDNMFSKMPSGEIPSYKDIMQLQYLDAVIKETLRLHASAGVARKVADDITLTNNGTSYTIPTGSYVYNFAMMGHRLDESVDEPLQFYPERFLDTKNNNTTSINNLKKNWFPFSYGPRGCVGQPLAMAELKVIVVHIIRRYNIKRNHDANEPIPVLLLTIKPNEVLIDFEIRC